MIQWNESLSVGSPIIDDDHKILIKIVNKLDSALINDNKKEIIEQILCELSEYCVYHFNREEFEMIKINYDKYCEHKNSHDTIIQTLSDLIYGYELNKVNIYKDLLKFLTDWVVNHITKEDRLVGIAINKKKEEKRYILNEAA